MLPFPTSMRRSGVTVIAVALVSTGCGGGLGDIAPRAHAPEAPSELAKCKVAASQESPLVTEWPASEKANLEARLREGGVVVSYAGCSMRLLPQCRASGTYGWRRTTTATDIVEIRDADELYAKLPLGAVALEAELARSGRLAVQTTVSGQFELRGWDRTLSDDPACAGATHVVGALSVGSFKLRSGGTLSAKGSVDVSGARAGSLGTSSGETILREAGSPDACKDASGDAPQGECSSPIQVFLWALPRELADRGAPGTIKVNFLSGNPDYQYDVAVSDRVLCQTPCSRWVDPAIPFTFKHAAGFLRRDERIEMPDLREQAPTGLRLDARAYPTKTARQVGGILMTTFGGIAVAAGTVFTAVGFAASGAPSGLRVAGLITLPAGLALGATGIYLVATSGSRVDIVPAQPGNTPVAAEMGVRRRF